MNQNDFHIRLERKEDHREVVTIVREAFWNVYRPGCLEHYVLNQMRSHPAYIPELSFVLEKDGKIIGQNVFVHASILADTGAVLPIAAMGPICIAPQWQHQGYGKRLLDYSLEKARAFGIHALCFEGNIHFYGKSGFDYAEKFGIRYAGLPEGADASFFLCKELTPDYLSGVRGTYAPPECYMVEEEAAEQFDNAFPKKEKQHPPGQLF